MPYAINLADITNTPAGRDFVLAMLLDPVLDRSCAIQIDSSRFDEMGVRLDCDEGRAEAIVDTIRIKYRKSQVRMYHSKTGNGSWKRV